MRKWLIGLAATVLTVVVTVLTTDVTNSVMNWIRGDHHHSVRPRPVVAITAYDQTNNYQGQKPDLTIAAENDGNATATNCVILWRPGMLQPFASEPTFEIEYSRLFALRANQSHRQSLTASEDFPVKIAAAPYNVKYGVKVQCDNAQTNWKNREASVYKYLGSS
jgi:hypothetical protein